MERDKAMAVNNLCARIASIATPALRDAIKQGQAGLTNGVLFRDLGLKQ